MSYWKGEIPTWIRLKPSISNGWLSRTWTLRCGKNCAAWMRTPNTTAFTATLEFGTAGLRGVLGAGTNRMNVYVVRRATQAVADYLNGTELPKCTAIAYDSRIGSDVFAREAAAVFAANGITAHLYPRLEPVPALSFAVRELHCGVGICITASHNPAQYNGYKVYGADGCQITPEAANVIFADDRKAGLLHVAEARGL